MSFEDSSFFFLAGKVGSARLGGLTGVALASFGALALAFASVVLARGCPSFGSSFVCCW